VYCPPACNEHLLQILQILANLKILEIVQIFFKNFGKKGNFP
jgi:hypothetical protein